MISAPTIMNSRCAARSVGQPSVPTSTFFNSTGNSTRKAAPARTAEDRTQPTDDHHEQHKERLVMPKTSPTSTAPR